MTEKFLFYKDHKLNLWNSKEARLKTDGIRVQVCPKIHKIVFFLNSF